MNLESKTVQQFIAEGKLSVEQACELPDQSRFNLESKTVQQLIAEGKLSVEQACELTIRGRHNLESEAVQRFIAEGSLSIEEACELSKERVDGLSQPKPHSERNTEAFFKSKRSPTDPEQQKEDPTDSKNNFPK